jgi:anionic cell wall polymer biosynthesis LytR-Cps2A-Psr (LCP) family protein
MEKSLNAKIAKLKSFNLISDLEDFLNTLETVFDTNYGSLEYSDYNAKQKRFNELTISTGGYSDNEEIIRSLPAKFDALYWLRSERGGKYTYKFNLQES